MTSDGGYANAGPYDNQPGMSVRDEFAKAIVASEERPGRSQQADEVREVYHYAQLLTDEKLRRDQADRDGGSEPAPHASEKPDPSLCGYVSSGAEAIEAIRVATEDVIGTLARGVDALSRDEGKAE